jgi:hypothetical protein
MTENKQVLMQLVNMLAGQLQGIGQQRQERSAQRQQFGMQQQGIQMQRQQIAEEKRRWELGKPQREAEAEATKLLIDRQKYEAGVTKQKEQIGTVISDYMAQEGISGFTNVEQAFEQIPGLKELGGQIGYIGEVLSPYMEEPITPVELLQWGASYESFAKAHPQYEGIVTPEAWAQRSTDMARIRELELKNPELANELLIIQTELARKDFESYDRRLAADLRPPAGPARQPGVEQGRALENFKGIVIGGGDPTDDLWMSAYGYIPETNEEKEAIMFQVIANYKDMMERMHPMIPGLE